MEIDAIGEILNISLGASATAISNMLDTRVDITTPTVVVMQKDEFSFGELDPAVAVEITYVEGLSGDNIMLLKRSDVKAIVEKLMMTEIAMEDFELNELYLSAVCEVMNQMMGASSTALADFLGEPVNISTPTAYGVENPDQFKDKFFPGDDPMVIVKFHLTIEPTVNSEFMNIMPVSLAKRIISAFSLSGMEDVPEEVPQAAPQPVVEQPVAVAAPVAPAPAPTPVPVPAAPAPMAEVAPTPPPMPAQPTAPPMGMEGQPGYPPPYYGYPPQGFMPPAPQPDPYARPAVEPRVYNVSPMEHMTFDQSRLTAASLNEEQSANLDLIMGVSLQVSAEIGRTKKPVKEILEFSQGTLVVLDKLAGEQVDIFVNGQCVAKGDVVVVDDSFGVRITEIIKKGDFLIGNNNK